MSKPSNSALDDDDDFIDDEDVNTAQENSFNLRPDLASPPFTYTNHSAAGQNNSFFSNSHSFPNTANPFADINMNMGSAFGSGFERFGSDFMGLRYPSSQTHSHHIDNDRQNDFFQYFSKDENELRGKQANRNGKEKKQEEQKEGEQSQKERLARLAKKIDIPQEQQVTIVDWAIRGPAEVIRLVLQYILIPYKERKYVFLTKDQWYNVDRLKLLEKYPEIQLPYLEDGEKIVCGTEAIIVYLLHKYNRTELLGTTVEQKVRVATAASILWELLEDYYELVYGEYDENLSWERAKDKYINQRFVLKLNRITSFLKHKNFPSSCDFTWVDFAAAEIVTILNEMDYRFKEQTPLIQNYFTKLFELPQFIVYRQSYRFHERPYNGFGAIYK